MASTSRNPADKVRARRSRRTSLPTSLAAAIKGWNTRDAFEAMDPLDAILLDNWIPAVNGIVTRAGSLTFATGLGVSAPVETLAAFRTAAINQFLAACGASIYEISTGTPVLVKATLQSARWQTTVFNSKQFWVNGLDLAQIYDGTTMAATGFTGATMSTMAGVGVFNNRLYFWTGVDPGFWYGGVNAISGALSRFDLSTVSQAGGNLIAVETLSYDGGTGISNYTCFFMSSGEVLIYQGTDPSNASNWALSGRYLISAPVMPRAIARYGGDIYITTANDHQQLSKLLIALKLGQTPPWTKASGAVQDAYQAGGALFGWEALYYPGGTWLLYNVPNADGTFSQHVYNTSTEAWCRLRSLNASTFGLFNGRLYFGTANGVVKRADTGSSDDGEPILSQAQQAWNLFETPLIKRVTAVRPAVESQGIADFNFGIGFDYQPPGISIPDSSIGTANALIWGATSWGSPHVWGGSGVTDPRWRVATGEGSALGFALSANTKIRATWVRTDLMFEPGAAL